jgi:hypothetical protein
MIEVDCCDDLRREPLRVLDLIASNREGPHTGNVHATQVLVHLLDLNVIHATECEPVTNCGCYFAIDLGDSLLWMHQTRRRVRMSCPFLRA